MKTWKRRAVRVGPQSDLRGFTQSAPPEADTRLMAFTDHFLAYPPAAPSTDAFMAGRHFGTAAFVAEIRALPSVEFRPPAQPGRQYTPFDPK